MEAKTDLARLQEVRARREAAAAQRKAEAEGESPSLQTLYGAHDCLRNTEKAQEQLRRRKSCLQRRSDQLREQGCLSLMLKSL